MGNEEQELLRKNIREFTKEKIEPATAKIEREGLDRETLAKMAVQGLLGARIPSEYGGAGLDEQAYMIVLEELARVSPSVAVKVLVTNSLFASLIISIGKLSEPLQKAASGEERVTVGFSRLLVGSRHDSKIKITNSRVSGVEDYVLASDADAILVVTDEPRDRLVLVENGIKPMNDYPRLGLRGLRFSSVGLDSDNFKDLSGDGLARTEKAFSEMSLEVAAISLGIASGALDKTIEYTKARSTFEQPLKNYQPVAFAVSSLKSSEDMLRSFIYRENLSETEKLMARVKSLELATAVAKQALQLHGGYGYFEDFGLERYYRDTMALSVLLSNRVKDMEAVSAGVFGSKAGYL